MSVWISGAVNEPVLRPEADICESEATNNGAVAVETEGKGAGTSVMNGDTGAGSLRHGISSRDNLRVSLYFYSLAGAGGAEKQLLGLAQRLALRGHVVNIISLDAESTRTFYAVPAEVEWHRLGWDRSFAGRLRRAWRLRQLVRREQMDVFVGFVMGGDKSIYAALAGTRTALVAAERNDPVIYRETFDWTRRWLYWLLFGLCDQIVVQLPAYRRSYPRWLRPRIEVIGNPIDPNAVGTAGSGRLSKRELRILNVGRLHRQKGQDLLLRAFARTGLAKSGWRLRIVGTGETGAELRRLADEIGVRLHVDFVEPTRDIRSEYDAADIFAFPSRYEGFPNALAEAMANGLPCVGLAACVGARDLVRNNVNGLVVAGDRDEEQVYSIADALCRLAENPGLRDQLGAQAARDMGEYASTAVDDEWVRVLHSVTSR